MIRRGLCGVDCSANFSSTRRSSSLIAGFESSFRSESWRSCFESLSEFVSWTLPSRTHSSNCLAIRRVSARSSGRELHYWSGSIAKQMAANVILPQAENPRGPYPVYYLLHGLSDDHTIWERRTSVERYVEGLPLIVVMPDGGRGFYTDALEGGPAYE